VILTGIKEFELVLAATTTTWQELLTQSAFAWIWEISLHWTGSEACLSEAIVKGTALAVSDGSYQQDQGACTWIIEGSTSSNQITG